MWELVNGPYYSDLNKRRCSEYDLFIVIIEINDQDQFKSEL